MHEVKFIDFVKGVGKGLWQAAKSDIDVFLLAVSAIIWPWKIFRGFSISTLLYVIFRRTDGLMSAYIQIKQKELNK